MAEVIFEPIEEEDGEQNNIVFNADVDGNVIECAISYQALTDHFEAEHSDPLFAFMMARSEVEKIAEKMILGGKATDNRLLITSDDVSNSLK